MTWTRGRRELVLSGRLPLEQGAAFEQAIWSIAKPQRAIDKQAGTRARLAAVGRRRARHTRPRRPAARSGGVQAQPHHPDRAPQRRRSRRCSKAQGRSAPRPPSGSPATRAASPSSPAAATSCTHASDAAPPTRSSARCTSAQRHCQYPGCTATRELEAHHLIPVERGGKTELDNLILLCPRHHKLLHDHHIRTSGNAEQPAFADAGRTRNHHQPATRTTASGGLRVPRRGRA